MKLHHAVVAIGVAFIAGISVGLAAGYLCLERLRP